MTADELSRLPELDVSEEGTAVYVQRGTRVDLVRRGHRRPPRSAEAWEPEVRLWQGFVRDGGAAFGAFDGDRLIGVAVLRLGLAKDTAQLAGLYIDRAWRRHGVATALVDDVAGVARAAGAAWLYVSAAPSGSAVGFYLSRGFEPTAEPDPELLELEPEDIHMVGRLAPFGSDVGNGA
jgi:GNAT superfamily N-acetyltransferase